MLNVRDFDGVQFKNKRKKGIIADERANERQFIHCRFAIKTK